MAKNENTKTRIALEFEIPKQDHDTLESAASGDLMAFLRAQLEAYLHELANGGLMLSGAEVARIGKSSKTNITSSEEVVELAEKVLKNVKGQKTYTVSIDPVLVESFQQNADVQGISIDELLSSHWNHIHANGWLQSFMPDVRWVPFSHDEAKKILKTEDPTAADVYKALKAAGAE